MPLRRAGIAIISAAPGPDDTVIIQEISHLSSFPSSNPSDAIFGILFALNNWDALKFANHNPETVKDCLNDERNS